MDDEKCSGKKRRRKEQVFGGGYSAVPVDLGEIQATTPGTYPPPPDIELPEHLKPGYLRNPEWEQLKQP